MEKAAEMPRKSQKILAALG